MQIKTDKAQSVDQVDLRSRAEERLAEKDLQTGCSDAEEDTKRLLHELQVHQVELEMQNEELRETRLALETSLEHYTDLYDFAQMGYFTLDGAGVIREINLAGIALLGEYRSQVIGKRLMAFLSHDSRAVFNDFIERIRVGRGKQSWTVTLLSENHKQSLRYLHIEGAPVLWPEQGSSRAVEGYVRLAALDITERKQAEEAMRQSEERYRLLVESANEGIVVEQDGLLKFVNASLLEMTGYSAEEFTSQPFISYVHPEDRQAIFDHLQRSLKAGNVSAGCDFRILDKVDQVKWLHSNSVGIEWERRPATLNFFTDVTEHKRAEEAEAGKEALLHCGPKIEAVGVLVPGVAHEVNNLLAVVMGLAELAKVLGQEKRDNTGEIDQIIQATERVSGLLRQMLTLSRKNEVHEKALSLSALGDNSVGEKDDQHP